MIISKFREIIGPNRSEGNPVYLSDVIFHYARSVENKQTPLPKKKTKQNKIKNKSVITRKTMEIASIC